MTLSGDREWVACDRSRVGPGWVASAVVGSEMAGWGELLGGLAWAAQTCGLEKFAEALLLLIG
jgi:hypothetical protein